MSKGTPSAGKNGTAEAARIAKLERRLLSSEAAEQRVHTELLKACERAEAAECDAARARQLQEHMQVAANATGQWVLPNHFHCTACSHLLSAAICPQLF